MYASAWIFVIAPIVVSFSTSEPRPITTSSPIVDALAYARLVAEDHARADLRPREDDRAGRDDRAGADLRAAAAARASPSSAARATAACRRRRPRAPSRRRRAPCRDRRSRCRTVTSRAARARATSGAARAPARPRAPSRATFSRSSVARDELEEVLALELERLVVRDLRAEDVAGARLPLAVGRRRGCHGAFS